MSTIAFLFIFMLALVLLGVPLVYSIGCASAVVILLDPTLDVTLIPSRLYLGVDSFVLASIPFFLLAAEILTSGGLIRRIILFARLLIGHLRGGLAQVNILVSMLFAGVQASCTADSAAIGGVLIPSMTEEGYDPDISAVVTATSSCCGPIIPPSILMLLYAFLIMLFSCFCSCFSYVFLVSILCYVFSFWFPVFLARTFLCFFL